MPEVLKGRELTAYIACKPEVQVAGATYIEANLHTDGNLVSGHAWLIYLVSCGNSLKNYKLNAEEDA